MDSSEFIQILKSKEPNEVHTTLCAHCKGEETKCAFLINVFCKHLINRNLWVVSKLHETILAMKQSESKKEKLKCTLELINILKYQKDRVYNIDLSGVKKESIDQIMYVYTVDRTTLQCIQYEDIFTPETFDLVAMLETCIMNNRQGESITLLKYILSLKSNAIFVKSSGCNIIWILFDILILICGKQIDTSMRDYVGICKDLFFYKVTAKQKLDRLPVLFVCLIVTLNGKLKCHKQNIPMQESRMSYLYVLTDIDKDVKEAVEIDRKRVATKVFPNRSLNVDLREYDRLEKLRQNIEIIKSN